MGYCIELVEHNFKIKKENIEHALNSLKEFMKTQDYLRWVYPKEVVNADSIYDAFYKIRYPLVEDKNGDYVLEYFAGEKLGNCETIFNSFAQFVEPNSFIEFEGEDGHVLKYVFDGSKCKEEWN